MKLTVDRKACTGAGNCVRLAPDWFDQDDDEGLVVLLGDAPPDGLGPLMRDVVDACPTGAIRVESS